MLHISHDKTNTTSYDMQGKCPFGGDRIGGVVSTPPALSDWYPNRLKVEAKVAVGGVTPNDAPLEASFGSAEPTATEEHPTHNLLSNGTAKRELPSAAASGKEEK